MIRFEPLTDRSKLSLVAQSSLHPINTSTNKLEGFFEVGVIEPRQFDLSVAANGRLEVYADDLKSDYSYVDRIMQTHLDTRRFPSIKAKLTNLRDKGNGRYFAVGEISFHGTTQRVENELTIAWLDDATIEIKGEADFDVRDFKVEPPTLMSISLQPVLKVKLKYVLKRVNTS